MGGRTVEPPPEEERRGVGVGVQEDEGVTVIVEVPLPGVRVKTEGVEQVMLEVMCEPETLISNPALSAEETEKEEPGSKVTSKLSALTVIDSTTALEP